MKDEYRYINFGFNTGGHRRYSTKRCHVSLDIEVNIKTLYARWIISTGLRGTRSYRIDSAWTNEEDASRAYEQLQ